MSNENYSQYFKYYSSLKEKELEEIIHDLSDRIEALLNVSESNSIEIFISTTQKLKFEITDIKRENNLIN